MTLNREEIDLERNLFKSNTNEISLKGFEQVLNKIENDMNDWLKKFGWNREVLFEKHNSNNASCSIVRTIKPILKKNDKHVLKCNLKTQNHQNEDILRKIKFN